MEPVKSVMVTAICAAMRTARVLVCLAPGVLLRVEMTAPVRLAYTAGPTPNTSAVTTASPIENTSTRQSRMV